MEFIPAPSILLMTDCCKQRLQLITMQKIISIQSEVRCRAAEVTNTVNYSGNILFCTISAFIIS